MACKCSAEMGPGQTSDPLWVRGIAEPLGQQRSSAGGSLVIPQVAGANDHEYGRDDGRWPSSSLPNDGSTDRVPSAREQGHRPGVPELGVEPLPRSGAVPSFDPDSAVSKASTRTEVAGQSAWEEPQFTRSRSLTVRQRFVVRVPGGAPPTPQVRLAVTAGLLHCLTCSGPHGPADRSGMARLELQHGATSGTLQPFGVHGVQPLA